jgi:hypothetical protein
MNNLDDVRLMAMAVAVGVALVGAAVMGGLLVVIFGGN